ncbi:MAG: pyruvate kinase, partial [Oscillospiraceae bacterium]|nr:pyruvate kinase [Oscillospiraceae bacterium]
MRRTKIVCTLGPSTDKQGVLREMLLSGMNVARFNFSHGTHEDHARRLNALKALREELNLPVASLLDTKGPEIRLRKFKDGKAELKTGQTFTLTTNDTLGDETGCSVTYKDLPQDLSVGSTVLLADGLIALTVTKIDGDAIICKAENGGIISDNKG